MMIATEFEASGDPQDRVRRLAVLRTGKRCCSDLVVQGAAQRVLFVGAERWDEFAEAIDLVWRGHSVIVVNPRKSHSARAFQVAGGSFVQSTIEKLEPSLGPFDLICEHYPFTITRVCGICERTPCTIWHNVHALRAYAMPRLKRLA